VKLGPAFHLAALPPPSLETRRTVRLYIATLLTNIQPSIATSIGTLGKKLWRELLNLELMQEATVMFVVGSEEERREAVEAVERLEEGSKSKFCVELEVET